jgi:PLP dependent protein
MMIADNLNRVWENIEAACARVGRDPSQVKLIAVSKTHPPEMILQAIQAGAQHFGENRVEESETKIPAVMGQIQTPVTWHMIGHIQSRKAKFVPPLFQVVHSVDTVKLASKLSQFAQESGEQLEVLIEVNVSGEASKSGFDAAGWSKTAAIREQFWAEFQEVLALPGLQVRGLMTMAPIVENAEQARPVFAELFALRESLQESLNIVLPDLSMGMTDDYPVAIEEGATMVRIGRAIFGERE